MRDRGACVGGDLRTVRLWGGWEFGEVWAGWVGCFGGILGQGGLAAASVGNGTDHQRVCALVDSQQHRWATPPIINVCAHG